MATATSWPRGTKLLNTSGLIVMMHVRLPDRTEITLCEAVTAFVYGESCAASSGPFDPSDASDALLDRLHEAAHAGRVRFHALPAWEITNIRRSILSILARSVHSTGTKMKFFPRAWSMNENASQYMMDKNAMKCSGSIGAMFIRPGAVRAVAERYGHFSRAAEN